MKNRIRELRKEKNLTLEEFSKAINSNRGSVSRYELGEVELKHETAKTIADFFNVSIDYLLCNSDIRKPEEQITIDPFTFALYGEVKDLTDAEKEDILDMVKKMKEIIRRK